MTHGSCSAREQIAVRSASYTHKSLLLPAGHRTVTVTVTIRFWAWVSPAGPGPGAGAAQFKFDCEPESESESDSDSESVWARRVGLRQCST